MRVPREVYHPSPRKFDPAPVELAYRRELLVRKVSHAGNLKICNETINISLALRGFDVGREPVNDDQFLVWFCQLCLGQINLATQRFYAAAPAVAAPKTPAVSPSEPAAVE